MTAKRNIVYTIGHSNHPIERFIELLKDDGIECLMDVRRFPTSKRYPQFNRASLSTRLLQESIDYQWLGNRLGGFRSGGYEIYMSSEDYQTGIAIFEEIAVGKLTAIMCAEQSYVNCHRRFISQTLTNQGWQVLHIFAKGQVSGHQGELL